MMEKLTANRNSSHREGARHSGLISGWKTGLGFPKSALRRFSANRRGNVAIIFAIALLPTLAAIGSAVDITRALQVKARLNSALDAAGLAAGKMIDADDATIIATATAYFKANYPADALGVPGTLGVSITDNTITLHVTARVETTIMKVAGFNEINVNSTNEISRAITGLEVALALDNTGSMAGTKLASLKSAAHDLVNILFGSDNSPAHLKVSLVPFADGVNVGPRFDPVWLDMAGASSIHGENFDFPVGKNLWTLFDTSTNMDNRPWNGCVMERPGGLDELDTPPTAGSPDTFFVPWLAPDEPNSSSPTYPNSYLSDGTFDSGTSLARKQESIAKYAHSHVTSTSKGPDYNCRNTQAITPLTNDKLYLEGRIDAMVAAYSTHIPIGLAWGWRTLSSGAPYTEGALYSDTDNIKALVLMTDGENTISGNSTHNMSTFTGYGYLSKSRLGTNSASTAVTRLDEKTTRVCNNIKAAGIRLYTIAFQVTAPATLALLRNCASTPEQFFSSSDGAALSTAFRAIATELASLRISK